MIKGMSKPVLAWLGLLVLLMLAGLAMFVNQSMNGLQVTGMRNPISWGLYIITFAFLVGMSAGGLIVSASAYIFRIEKLKSLAPVGVVAAVASVLGAMAMIIPDMGHPERLLNILVGMRFTSPILWDLVVITVYLLIGLFEIWVLFFRKAGSNQARERVLEKAAWVAFPVAILVHSVTAWIFGLQVGRPFWNSALMAPIFLSSAVVSGLGLILVIGFVGRNKNIPGLDAENRAALAKMLAAFIALDLFLLFCDLFTPLYAGGTAEAASARVLVSGALAPIFWSEIVLGALLPFVLLVAPQTRGSAGWLGLAGLLVMLGVFAKRINIILPGYLHPNVSFSPGISTGDFSMASNMVGTSPFVTVPTYAPTITEITIVFGVLAMVAFVLTIGVRMAAEHREALMEGVRA